MATEKLNVKILADASQAKAEISKFKDQLKGISPEAAKVASSIGKITTAVGGLTLALKGIKALIQNAIDVAAQGDAIKDNAQKVMMSTTAYQEWGYVLKQNGIEMANLKTSMRKFSQLVTSNSDVLRKYGITATNVDEAFEQAVYTIQNLGTETERLAAAQELFGNRAAEMMPLLNMTNAETQGLMETYRAIGGTMSNELIAASDLCTDSINEMKVAWGGLRNLLATYVIPVVTRVVQWITVAIAKIRILLAAFFGLKESFGGGGKKSIAGTTGSVAVNTGKTAGNLKKANKQAKELKRTLMGIDELSKLAEKATAAATGGGGGGGGVGGIDASGIEALGEVFDSETLEKIEKFREKIEAIKDTLNGIWKIIKGLGEILLFNDWENGLHNIWEGLTQIFPKLNDIKEKWDAFKTSFKEKIENAIGIKIPTWSDIKASWNKLKDKFTGKNVSVGFKLPKWSDLKDKWQALKDKFTGKTASIKLAFDASVQNLKNWINNNVIDKINNKLRQAPIIGSWLGQHPIPRLARGGVLTAPTTAILGEYAGAKTNPEIATPQSLMYETIKNANGDLVSALATMTRQVIQAIENKDMTVAIGDEQVARSAQRGNTAYYNRTGKALLTI